MAARDPANGSCYYGWMLQGEALFQDLEPSHPLLTALPITGPGCFETFPHAITCTCAAAMPQPPTSAPKAPNCWSKRGSTWLRSPASTGSMRRCVA